MALEGKEKYGYDSRFPKRLQLVYTSVQTWERYYEMTSYKSAATNSLCFPIPHTPYLLPSTHMQVCASSTPRKRRSRRYGGHVPAAVGERGPGDGNESWRRLRGASGPLLRARELATVLRPNSKVYTFDRQYYMQTKNYMHLTKTRHKKDRENHRTMLWMGCFKRGRPKCKPSVCTSTVRELYFIKRRLAFACK